MKKLFSWWRIIAVFAIMALAIFVCGRKETKGASKMSTELEMKHQIDLGMILDTTIPIELFLPVKNRSARQITISRVSKDCSCTSVSIDKTVLAPGEVATIRVHSNLSGKTDRYLGEVVIESDATEKIDEIQVTGQITGQIRVRPLRTTVVMGDKYAAGSFTIFCDDQNGKWKYTGFTAEDPNLNVEITPKSTSPTTSTYAGVVHIPAAAQKSYPDFGTVMVKLKFENENLKRSLDLNFAVDLVIRRKITTDPAQVTFNHATKDQKRTVLVQSGDAIKVDSVTCGSPCVKSSLRWIDPKTLIVDLAFNPSAGAGKVPEDLACDLHAGGKRIASIPIHVVQIP
jgi:hypothetical protein